MIIKTQVVFSRFSTNGFDLSLPIKVYLGEKPSNSGSESPIVSLKWVKLSSPNPITWDADCIWGAGCLPSYYFTSFSNSSTLFIIKWDIKLQKVLVSIDQNLAGKGVSCDPEVGDTHLVGGYLHKGHRGHIDDTPEERQECNHQKDRENTDLEGPRLFALLWYQVCEYC